MLVDIETYLFESVCDTESWAGWQVGDGRWGLVSSPLLGQAGVFGGKRPSEGCRLAVCRLYLPRYLWEVGAGGDAVHPSTLPLQPCFLSSVQGGALGERGAKAVSSLKTAYAQGFSFPLSSSKAGGIGAPVII